jgi:hypothetical protein
MPAFLKPETTVEHSTASPPDSTTALVHELYLKSSRAERTDWRDRAHFLSVCAVAMRHILIERARRRAAEKRGGPNQQITLDDELIATDSRPESLLELHEALDHLFQALVVDFSSDSVSPAPAYR